MAANGPLGELERVPVREVWPDEARDFTPWLAEHAQHLGEALGLDLDLVASEVAVGPFSADLVFDDSSTDGRVVVENMFGATDHDHVGKLLTYAAGLDATCAVLVAERFRPEHLSAIAWMNTVSREGTAFFGIEIEVWRIGGSEPAPRLNVVVKPDGWSREVRSATIELSSKRQLYRDWWSEFLPVLRETYPGWTNARSPQAQNWMNFPTGRSGLTFSTSFAWPHGYDGQHLRVELYVDPGDAAESDRIFAHLFDSKSDIEAAVGGPLDWETLEGRRAVRISLVHPDEVDVTDEAKWPELRAWAIQALGRFRDAFTPHIRSLPSV